MDVLLPLPFLTYSYYVYIQLFQSDYFSLLLCVQVIEEEKLQEQCLALGDYFLKKLLALRDEYQVIGDVRGTGLMLGMEMVEDRV